MLIGLSLTTDYLQTALPAKTLPPTETIDMNSCLLSGLKQGNALLYFNLFAVWKKGYFVFAHIFPLPRTT
jgi:hypothetical protein